MGAFGVEQEPGEVGQQRLRLEGPPLLPSPSASRAVLLHSPNRHIPGLEGAVVLYALLEGHTPVLLGQHQQQRCLHLGVWGVMVSRALGSGRTGSTRAGGRLCT